jgi:hypothetical protein
MAKAMAFQLVWTVAVEFPAGKLVVELLMNSLLGYVLGWELNLLVGLW